MSDAIHQLFGLKTPSSNREQPFEAKRPASPPVRAPFERNPDISHDVRIARMQQKESRDARALEAQWEAADKLTYVLKQSRRDDLIPERWALRSLFAKCGIRDADEFKHLFIRLSLGFYDRDEEIAIHVAEVNRLKQRVAELEAGR